MTSSVGQQRLTGGGTSAVAASTHAGCPRFRHTDSLLIGMSRRQLAGLLGTPDATAGIPVARRIRAGLFERLVRADAFASRIATVTAGQLGLVRPTEVHRIDCQEDVDRTAAALSQAHAWALVGGATMLSKLAVPFPGLEADVGATAVLPDYAVVAARHEGGVIVGSWLVMGDAKDYERVRTVIDDHRMLKGFLQVAMGAEAADRWSVLPGGMVVHSHGTLAVPRNSFLQPTAVTEDLSDHRDEVRGRADERAALVEQLGEVPLDEDAALDWVAHRQARFDPASCSSCALHDFCRAELRLAGTTEALLIEVGVPPEHRQSAAELVDGTGEAAGLPDVLRSQVLATITGEPVWLGVGRTDPAGQPGTVEVVLAKSDSAATGIHGIAMRVTGDGGPGHWTQTVLDQPQAPGTRLDVLALIGEALAEAMEADRPSFGDATRSCRPVHLVVPESVTADVLVSIADSAAGVELSRLRWEHDVAQGREALTFAGEPADIPAPLTDAQRLAVSFLLEEDRGRTMVLRSTVVDLTSTLGRHLVTGGSAFQAGRLDHLLAWATGSGPLDHRDVADQIAASPSTPGARLANTTSDRIHDASSRGKHPDTAAYAALVTGELAAKQRLVEQCIEVLDGLADSRLRAVHRQIEADAQAVWWRRFTFGAADLIRFGRTFDFWRDRHVDLLDQHDTTSAMLRLLVDPTAARQAADDAGSRHLAHATVVAVDPVRLTTGFRRRADDHDRVLAVTINDNPTVEGAKVQVKTNMGAFKLEQLPLGPLLADDQTDVDSSLSWDVHVDPDTPLAVGDRLVLADYGWFPALATAKHQVKIIRPGTDDAVAPKTICEPSSYGDDPDAHQWCCMPHTVREANTADYFAERREQGLMNPEVWPPLTDTDGFDVPDDAPTDQDITPDVAAANDGLTIDDLD